MCSIMRWLINEHVTLCHVYVGVCVCAHIMPFLIGSVISMIHPSITHIITPDRAFVTEV